MILTLTSLSSARKGPRGASKDANEQSIWISCKHSVSTANLEQILQKEARVHCGQQPPKEGDLSSVVLCVKDTEGLSESVERIRKLYPDTPVLVFGPHADLLLTRNALKAGARGYIHAEMKPDQLVRALKVASEGELVTPRKLLEYLVNGVTDEELEALDALSLRQREIL